MKHLIHSIVLDEFYGINNTTVNFPVDSFHSPSDDAPATSRYSSEKKQIMLNSKEDLFAELRDKNFNAVSFFCFELIYN